MQQVVRTKTPMAARSEERRSASRPLAAPTAETPQP